MYRPFIEREDRRARRKTFSVIVLTLVSSMSLLTTSCGLKLKTSTEYLIEGNNYFRKGDYAKAEVSYREALERDRNNPTVKSNLGVILCELGNYDEAITILQDAIKIDQKNAIAHYVLARALNQKGRQIGRASCRERV